MRGLIPLAIVPRVVLPAPSFPGRSTLPAVIGTMPVTGLVLAGVIVAVVVPLAVLLAVPLAVPMVVTSVGPGVTVPVCMAGVRLG